MKQKFSLSLAAVVALSLSACGGGGEGDLKGEPVEAVAPPQGQQWRDTVSQTEEGGYLVGNPDAEIKLVEYASLTCSHCAEFEEQAFPELFEEYVETGKVNLEIRNFLLNPYDIPITLLTRCSGAGAYLALTQEFFKNQAAEMGKLQNADAAAIQAAAENAAKDGYLPLGQAMGIIDFFKARGISEDQAKACLSDKKASDALIAMTEKGSKEVGVTGTPFFLINGQKIDFSGWPGLETKLQQAGAR